MSILAILIFTTVGLGLVILAFQEKLIFYPTQLIENYKFDFAEAEELVIQNHNEKISALLFHGQAQPNNLIIYFHGNAEALNSWGFTAAELAQKTGQDILIVDYPGYGKSTGKITSEKQLHQFAERVYEEAEKRAPGNIILYGRSLGSGLATKLAAEKPIKALILETPFLSGYAQGQSSFPLIPLFLIRYKFRNDEHIKKTKAPILIIHGTNDVIVSYDQAKALHQLAPQSTFVTIQGGNHNDLPATEDYWRALELFLNEKLQK